MSKKPDNPSAYPNITAVMGGGMVQPHVSTKGGMSLRDYFAGQTLASGFIGDLADNEHEKIAEFCYDRADAMLAEREKRNGGGE